MIDRFSSRSSIRLGGRRLLAGSLAAGTLLTGAATIAVAQKAPSNPVTGQVAKPTAAKPVGLAGPELEDLLASDELPAMLRFEHPTPDVVPPVPEGAEPVLTVRLTGDELAMLSVDELIGLERGDLVRFSAPGLDVDLQLKRADRLDARRSVWRFVNRAGERVEHAVFVSVDDVIAGAIHGAGEFWWKIESETRGTVRMEARSDEDVPSWCGGTGENPLGLDVPIGGDGAGVEGGIAGSTDCTSNCASDTIDVAFFYTASALNGAGGEAEMLATIELAVQLANDAFEASAIDLVVRAITARQTDYDDQTQEGHLGKFADGNDGYMDEVQVVMDQVGADTAALIVEQGEGYCGVAYLGPARYQVDVRGCIGGYLFAHELGHNLGACHACGDGGGCNCGGFYDYSVGWRFVGFSGTQWRTVMAYSPGARIGQYSNPEVQFDGVATGVPAGAVDQADNALTLNELGPIVGGFACATGEPMVDKLLASDGSQLDLFGDAIAIAGSSIVVGAYWSDELGSNSGSAYVFERADGSVIECPPGSSCWIEDTKLPAGPNGPGDVFGSAIDATPDVIVVGAYRDDVEPVPGFALSDAGSARVYTQISGSWCFAQSLELPGAAADDWAGFAVAVDGDLIAVGTPRRDAAGAPDAGLVTVYERAPGADWFPSATFNGADSGDWFGSAVALDGDRVAIGAYRADSEVGVVEIHVRNGGAWTLEDTLLGPKDAGAFAWFGSSLDLDGDRLVVGAPFADSGEGRAYVFERSGSDWVETAELRSPAPATSSRFGDAVAIEGSTIAIGAPRYDNGTNDEQGVVWIARARLAGGDSWRVESARFAIDGEEGDQYGSSLAFVDGELAIGATYDNEFGIQSGSVYVTNTERGPDCDGDDVDDVVELLAGAVDADENGVPDSCEGACTPDFDGDGIVSGADLTFLLSNWGDTGPALPADLDGNGIVGGSDLTVLLAAWGDC